MNTLHQIAYCSLNRIPADELPRELHAILDASRRNNAPLGVTGALLYNQGSFAQVLEGPLPVVERIFEAIQCDPRHSDVMVIASGPIEKRSFPLWSMAFAGHERLAEIPEVAVAFEDIFGGAGRGAQDLLRLLQELVIEEGEWANA
ncbi:MAG: BLUF domain-containing protein [Acidobacteriaceae bacterium]|nr:BLUF domain-containing protein [Acidobacteriaceae bacterium]